MLRFMDIVLSAAGLVLSLPLVLAAMLVIRLESRGPAIFAQRRVGRFGEPFTCFKLRTMASGTREGASHEVGGQGITRVGRFLRRTKIDELPQLWNVLRGEMSLVGPRPCLPSMDELIAERARCGVDRLRPGITGPAQLAGIDMSQPTRLATADSQWLEQASLVSYWRILLATLAGAGSGDAALIP